MIEVTMPLYKGARNLRLVLEGLTRQTFTQFKVRIACDGGDKDLAKVVEEYQDRLDAFFYYLPPETTERRLSDAKNLAAVNVDESTQRILVLDSDCVPGPNVVASHIPFSDEKIIACGVRYRIPEETAKGLKVADFDKIPELANDIDDRYTTTPSWKEKRLVDIRMMESRGATFPHLCHGFQVSYPLTEFYEVGMFDSALKFREDQDIAQKLTEQGCTTLIMPDSVCYHLDHPMVQYDVRREAARIYEGRWGKHSYQ